MKCPVYYFKPCKTKIKGSELRKILLKLMSKTEKPDIIAMVQAFIETISDEEIYVMHTEKQMSFYKEGKQ